MRRTLFPRKSYDIPTVIAHFTDLFNLHTLYGRQKIEDFKTWLQEAGGWNGHQILRAETTAVHRSNFRNNLYLSERLDSKEADVLPMIQHYALNSAAKIRSDAYERKKKKRCDCCGMSVGRHRKWMQLPCSGLIVCMPCRDIVEGRIDENDSI